MRNRKISKFPWFVGMSDEMDAGGRRKAVVECVDCGLLRNVQQCTVHQAKRCRICHSIPIEVCLSIPHVLSFHDRVGKSNTPRFRVRCVDCGEERILGYKLIRAERCRKCSQQRIWDANRPVEDCENFVRVSEINDYHGNPTWVFECEDCSEEIVVRANRLNPRCCQSCSGKRSKQKQNLFVHWLKEQRVENRRRSGIQFEKEMFK